MASAVIDAPAEEVYALITDPREWRHWAVWNRRDAEMKMEYVGAPTGVGLRWSCRSKTEGNGEMEFTKAKSLNRLVGPGFDGGLANLKRLAEAR